MDTLEDKKREFLGQPLRVRRKSSVVIKSPPSTSRLASATPATSATPAAGTPASASSSMTKLVGKVGSKIFGKKAGKLNTEKDPEKSAVEPKASSGASKLLAKAASKKKGKKDGPRESTSGPQLSEQQDNKKKPSLPGKRTSGQRLSGQRLSGEKPAGQKGEPQKKR